MLRRISSPQHPVDFLVELLAEVLHGDVFELSRGSLRFDRDGVLITDDAEDEFLPENDPPVVVETPYAVPLSWLFFRLEDGLGEVAMDLHRRVFCEALADAALGALARETDLYGLLLAVIARAAVLTAAHAREHALAIRDELIASAGALSDLAEKIG